jgi:outer membrane protein TolC
VIDNALCDPKRMVESGMRHEIQIAQIRYNMFANAENADYIRNSLLPSVRFEARSDVYSTVGDGIFNTAQPVEGRDLSAALLVTIPLFGSTFEKWNALRLEEIDRAINETQIDALFRRHVLKVRNILLSLDEIRSRIAITLDIEKLAAQEFDISRLRFELGSVGSFDMIRTKNEYYNAQDELTSLRFTLLRRIAEIERDYPMDSADPA